MREKLLWLMRPRWPVLCCAALTLALPALAIADQVRFQISAQPLPAALRAFEEQAHMELLYEYDAVRNARGNAVFGDLGRRAALEMLLKNTGLEAVFISDTEATIRPIRASTRSRAGSAVPIPKALQNDTRKSNASAEAPVPQIAQGAPGSQQTAALQEITVTGTRIAGTQIAAPIQTLTRVQIEEAGYSTLEEAFESLPQNFADLTPGGREAVEGGSLLDERNNTRVTGVDLQGLGAESTLVLVNGERVAGGVAGRVVDISDIPLSVVQSIDVVTGGRSATYGTDAVAGVVNLQTRQDFDGLQSDVYLGNAAAGGGQRLDVSQIGGITSDGGGFVAAYDYQRYWKFDVADVGLLNTQFNPASGQATLNYYAQAPTTRDSAYLAGHYDLTDRIDLYGTGVYTYKKYHDLQNYNYGAPQNSYSTYHDASQFYTVSAGAKAALSDWTLDVSGSASAHADTYHEKDLIVFPGLPLNELATEDSTARVSAASAVVTGPLPELLGIKPKAAAGLEWRHESLRDNQNATGDVATVNAPYSRARNIHSAFAEITVPLIAHGSAGARRLELSAAGRYDHYSDFGGTFNPQMGVIFSPGGGLSLRASWASAFRAPSLGEFNERPDDYLQLVSDPTQNGAAVPVLFQNGVVADLGPEKAKTWTAGFDYNPASASWLKTSFSYFHVRYVDRIEIPALPSDASLVLDQSSQYPELIGRSPAAAEVAGILGSATSLTNLTGVPFDPSTQSALAVFPNLVVFDDRQTNLAIERLQAIDGAINATFDEPLGTINLGVNAAYTLDHERQVSPTSAPITLLNLVGKPAALRLRGTAGLTRGAFGVLTSVNYIGKYTDPFSTPPSSMASWTTADATLRFDGSKVQSHGLLSGFVATASVQNLFDSSPPRFNESLVGLLYDSTNANPFGRYVSLRLSERW